MLKKVFSVLMIAGVSAGAVWAVDPPALYTIPTEVGALGLQAKPQSAVNATSGRFKLDEDNFLDVIKFQGVEFQNMYFFLGGSTASRGLQGGFAKKLNGFFDYLAFYANAKGLDGEGSNNGADESDNEVAESLTAWNNEFSLLLAGKLIGAIRLDVLMGDASGGRRYSSSTNGVVADGTVASEVENTGKLITSIQWGKTFGKIKPKVAVGYKWPEYEKKEFQDDDTPTNTYSKNAALGLKAEIEVGSFAGDYQFTMGFGGNGEDGGLTRKTTGYWDHTLNLYYNLTAPAHEKLVFKIRPQMQFRFAGRGNKWTDGDNVTYQYYYLDSPNLTAVAAGPQTWFQFSPIVETGVQFQATKRLALYSGLKLKLLTVTKGSEGSYTNTVGGVDDEHKDTPSAWEVKGLTFGPFGTGSDLEFAADFIVTPSISLNFSFATSLLTVGVPGGLGATGSTFTVNNPLTQGGALISGAKLVLNFKPGFKPGAEEDASEE